MAKQPIDQLKIVTFGVKAVFIGLFFLSVMVLFVLLNFSYEQFTLWIIQVYGKLEKLNVFRSNYLTRERYAAARTVAGVFSFLLIIIMMKLSSLSNFVVKHILSWGRSFQQLYYYLIESYRPMNWVQKTILWSTIILLIAMRWFFMHRYYFQNDELFSYLFFVRKGFLVLVSYYPGPNNHIFYSLLAYLTQVFSLNPFYTMKLPSFLAASIAPLVLYLFLRRYYTFSVSLVGMLLFTCSIHFFYYSLFGRGYALVTIFTIFTFFMGFEIMEGNNQRFIWHTYVLFSILGFYTLPSYLYAFVSTVVAVGAAIIIKKRIHQIRPFLYYHFMITIIVLILYSPIVIINGVASLTSNPWVARLENEKFFLLFPGMIRNMFGYLTNMEKGGICVSMMLFTIVTFILIRSKKMYKGILIASFFSMPVIMLMIQKVNPFDRVWTYLILPYSVCIVIVVEYTMKWFTNSKIVEVTYSAVISVTIICYTIYNFYHDTNHGHMIYDEVARISLEIVKEGNGMIYTNEDLYNLYIRYESSAIGNEIVPDMSVNSNHQYSHILLIPKTTFPESIRKDDYLLKEQNPYIEVYKLK